MEQNERPHLSVVIPAYNEQEYIGGTLREAAGYLNACDYRYEIIVVDDGSTDRTADLAGDAAGLFRSFALLRNGTNRGKGYSVKRGVLAAKGANILFMDADNATRINEVEKLLAEIRAGYDIAIGSRRDKGANITVPQPLHRIILGKIYILLSNIILGTSMKDYNCGFKLFTDKSSRKLFPMLTRDGWSFDSELIFLAAKYELKVKAVPVTWADRKTTNVRPLLAGLESFRSLCAIRLLDIRKRYL